MRNFFCIHLTVVMVCAATMTPQASAFELEYLGTTSYPTRDVVVYESPEGETFAYAAQGASVGVYRVGEDGAEEVNRVLPQPKSIMSIARYQNFLFIGFYKTSTWIYSLENPQDPQFINSVPISMNGISENILFEVHYSIHTLSKAIICYEIIVNNENEIECNHIYNSGTLGDSKNIYINNSYNRFYLYSHYTGISYFSENGNVEVVRAEILDDVYVVAYFEHDNYFYIAYADKLDIHDISTKKKLKSLKIPNIQSIIHSNSGEIFLQNESSIIP